MPEYYHAPPIPKAFIWRRAHSFTGLWLVLFLISHLLTNSQAALWVGEDGQGFVHAVNSIQELPYIRVIEIILIGIPFLIHGWWGISYLLTAQYNSFQTDGSAPALPHYPLNQAYTWQRITSWLLLVGIIAHVVHMRFIEYPLEASIGTEKSYMVTLKNDQGLATLSQRLGFDLYSPKELENIKNQINSQSAPLLGDVPSSDDRKLLQQRKQEQQWLAALQKHTPTEKEVVAVAKSFGMAELLVVRESFKNPMMIILYTGLVLAACFHAFNGLWTFMISWGITLTLRSQQLMRMVAIGLMVIITFLGLAAVWGSYWINLYY